MKIIKEYLLLLLIIAFYPSDNDDNSFGDFHLFHDDKPFDLDVHLN